MKIDYKENGKYTKEPVCSSKKIPIKINNQTTVYVKKSKLKGKTIEEYRNEYCKKVGIN